MDQALDVAKCDLACKENNTEHHTVLFGVDQLIVRRGQPFTISLHLNQGIQPQNGINNLAFIAKTGPIPSEISGTQAKFGVSKFISRVFWSATVTVTSETIISVTICPSYNAPIGLYTLLLDQGQQFQLGEFVLLFNPWCKRDGVYMLSEEERQEYVLSQDGLIYRGTPLRMSALPWNFAQFEPGILDICLKILDKNLNYLKNADQDCSERNNPVYVTRVVSAMINSLDDRGVLVGNWSGDFSDGVPPTKWKESASILREWAEHGPVKYGQCWVFAAVACTVSRALGIPCRVVTNFGSAHDTNGDLLVKYFHHIDDETITEDSIWNFHVWNESWMTRPDLKLGYEGWQASDSTPQEMSDGIFCCGPVPVRAIKEGELTFLYDCPFLYAEVNADVEEYIILSNGEEIKVSGSTTEVGKNISTKAVGKNEREDITHLYKYPEDSEEERKVFEKAQKQSKLVMEDAEPGLHIRIKVPEEMVLGSDYEVLAIIKNNTPDIKSCKLMFYAQVETYNGKLGATCGLADLTDVRLTTGEEKQATLKLEYAQYGEIIRPEGMIRLIALLIDNATRELHRVTKTVLLTSPDITVIVDGEGKVNHELSVQVLLYNPLPEPLENCSFSAQSPNLTQGKTITQKVGTVGPGDYATTTFEFTPMMTGKRNVVVDFNSDKLSNITAYETIDITE
ncbi:protein-glutamine gamma-glutamyltransferase 2a [Chanos chanos]|uniref:Protein-glutamine gamma-glutamyltransferase 2 n=1 Tax=Chanos chanos TaxID=29144 RepID=A0A6J2WB25_CHACN|nr:protein-glutamine gamma-glutamyltransferase 2-like [Chanos chanos]